MAMTKYLPGFLKPNTQFCDSPIPSSSSSSPMKREPLLKRLARRRVSLDVTATTVDPSTSGCCTEDEICTTTNVEFVERWIEFQNERKADCLLQLADTDCDVVLGNLAIMAIREFVDELRSLFEAFPDYRYRYETMEEREPGVVVLKNGVASGTHTGKPYGFGPYPEMEPEGVKCQSEPETIVFHVNGGAITNVRITTPSGEGCGPPGFYEQIGGFPL